MPPFTHLRRICRWLVREPGFTLTVLRQTLRRLRREPGFSATVLLTLALCIGANVAIFAVVDAIIVRPLPFPDAGRLVILRNKYPRAGGDSGGASATNYYDRRGKIGALASVSLHQEASTIVGADGSPNRVSIARVSPEFFATLGVPLALGHMFTDAEMIYGADRVVVLTDAYWRKQFDADPNIVGKRFINDGVAVTILGVLPRGFRYLSSPAQLYRPASHGADDIRPATRHNNNYRMIARLAPGATLAEAQAQMDAFNAELSKDDPYVEVTRKAGYRTGIFPLHADFVQSVRPILLLLQCAVLVLLLIGAINLVNLLLIRANGRAKDLAVRQALGATRYHVFEEVLCETLLLALSGGGLGLLAGVFAIGTLTRLGVDQLPLGGDIALDGRVAAVALLGALVVGVLLALPLLLFNLRSRLAPVLHAESRCGTVGRSALRVRHGFIVAQISLAFVLLAGAGLLSASLYRILSSSPGFRSDHALTGSITLPWKSYPNTAARLAFLERLSSALREQPGVDAVGLSSGLPFGGSWSDDVVVVEGVARDSEESLRTHYTSFALGDYWRALGIPLLEGRLLEKADEHSPQRVCVVDVDFANRYWPGQSALGRRIAQDVNVTEDNAATIVGVVGRIKHTDLAETDLHGAVYFPYKNYDTPSFFVALRTPLDPAALTETLRKTVLGLDPGLPVDNIRTMETLVADSLVARRSPALLTAAFASVALLLAGIGTYGVLAYSVGQRRREIGVRMALGATRDEIARNVFRRAGLLALSGILVGCLLAFLAFRLVRSALYGVGPGDPLPYMLSATVLGAAVFLAAWLPARRAARIDPIEALRSE